MPQVRSIPGPYHIYFMSFDCAEPVHVARERFEAKFWIRPVRLARNHGFTASELRRIHRLLFEYQNLIVEAWNEHCHPE
jgi:hypothetical protein